MSLEMVRKALLWCVVINYGVLIVWFHVSVEQFDTLHYAGMAIFKIGILLFNLVPYIALRVVGRADTK